MEKPNEPTAKKLTIRDRKKAQPKALVFFSDEEKSTIQKTVANTLDAPQTALFFYQCQALGLNPLLNEIAAITYNTKNPDGTYSKRMSIQVMRDGFLTIAHRSGKFAGIESGVNLNKEGVLISGWAKVYHKDFEHPVYQEADLAEYKSDRNPLWNSKPKTMIKKVAESMALRKAFNVSGVYAPEEMESEIAPAKTAPQFDNPDGDATEAQIGTIKILLAKKDLGGETPAIVEFEGMTKSQAAEQIKKLSMLKEKKTVIETPKHTVTQMKHDDGISQETATKGDK